VNNKLLYQCFALINDERAPKGLSSLMCHVIWIIFLVYMTIVNNLTYQNFHAPLFPPSSIRYSCSLDKLIIFNLFVEKNKWMEFQLTSQNSFSQHFYFHLCGAQLYFRFSLLPVLKLWLNHKLEYRTAQLSCASISSIIERHVMLAQCIWTDISFQ
jgi:hypothetical protein